MIYMLHVGMKAEDYAMWEAGFNGCESKAHRKEIGQGAWQIFRSPDGDPNTFTMLMEWESVEKAKAFLESEELKELNRESGLIEMGEAFCLVEVDKGTLD